MAVHGDVPRTLGTHQMQSQATRTGSTETEPCVKTPQLLALTILRKYGWNITSFQALEPGLSYWFDGEDTCVAYMDTGRAWVVAGAPIAAEPQLAQVSDEFCRAAEASGRRVAFFATEHRFLEAAGYDSIAIGEQPIWDPADWGDTVATTRSLREQLKRARNKGVTVRRVEPSEIESPDAPLRLTIEALIARWIGQKAMPPMGFLVRAHPFSFIHERRTFIAMLAGEVVGFAGAIPVYARSGWFIEDLIRVPYSPNGTVELLVDAAMRDAAALGSKYVTLGLAPLAGAVEFWLSTARKYGSALFDFAGLHAFKAKFRPREWASIYLAFPPGEDSVLAIYDSLAAFARGQLLRFGIEAFLRGPDVVVRLLATMLVPWTILLSQVDANRWFLVPWLKWFWVLFDVLLCGTLIAMSTRLKRRMANVTFALVLFDAIATLVQALFVDISRLATIFEAITLILGVSAPAIACIILFHVRQRILRTHRARLPAITRSH
jgi:phosphatidylglycerol lysyltransferase